MSKAVHHQVDPSVFFLNPSVLLLGKSQCYFLVKKSHQLLLYSSCWADSCTAMEVCKVVVDVDDEELMVERKCGAWELSIFRKSGVFLFYCTWFSLFLKSGWLSGSHRYLCGARTCCGWELIVVTPCLDSFAVIFISWGIWWLLSLCIVISVAVSKEHKLYMFLGCEHLDTSYDIAVTTLWLHHQWNGGKSRFPQTKENKQRVFLLLYIHNIYIFNNILFFAFTSC